MNKINTTHMMKIQLKTDLCFVWVRGFSVNALVLLDIDKRQIHPTAIASLVTCKTFTSE